jgi:DNA-binding MarR family transcriptional regulator
MNEMGLVELFWNVHRRLMKRLTPLARRQGMSISEMVVLWKAHKLGECRVTALADDLGVPPSTVTGMMDRLVEGGWLARERDPEDRRAVVMKSTPALGELVRSLKHEGSRTLEKALHGIPAAVRDRLGADLASVLECLEQEERTE